MEDPIKEPGVDATINYKEVADLTAALSAAAPDGVDIYFDNAETGAVCLGRRCMWSITASLLPAEFPGNDVLNSSELDFYVSHFERSGFTPAINWYRNISRNWKAGLDIDQTVRVPSLMVSAANDVLRPSMVEGVDAYVTDLEKHILADCWYWTPEERPAELNQLVISWLERRYARH